MFQLQSKCEVNSIYIIGFIQMINFTKITPRILGFILKIAVECATQCKPWVNLGIISKFELTVSSNSQR